MLFVLLFFLAAFLALAGRLFVLQIVNHQEYQALAAKQHRFVKDLLPERGIIYARDKNGNLIPLALNQVQKTLAASPQIIKDAPSAAEMLSRELNLEKISTLEKLSKENDAYEVIAKKVDLEIAEKISPNLPTGLFFEEEKRRIYPHETLAAHLLGFVSVETDQEEGRYGLERFYDDNLSGQRGILRGAKDAAGFWVALGKKIIYPSKNGSSVALTIDYNIQTKAEEVLSGAQKKWGAPSGLIMVLEPSTGRMLAQASRPVFNPNEFSKEKDFSVFLNPAAEAMYEFGSVLKPLTMAAGLQEKAVRAESTYEDTGEVKIGGFTIKNFDLKAYGVQTMTQVIEKSLNTGMVHVARALGKERQLEYLQKFGLGERTRIDLPGEVTGNISNLLNRREIDYATASFGQGIALTPIQLASAIAAIANGGKLLKPFVVDTIADDSGNIYIAKPEMVREVISPETAETVTKMLVSAVKNGFENRAGVKGYFVAGKTGTAQIPKKDGRGYSDEVIHTFVGYAPAFDPKFLILLQLNEPKGNRFAANTLTPPFHDLAEFILNYYEIPPDEK